MSLLTPGEHVRGDTYEVERIIGEGAFAEVYRVRHRFLGRQAMKVFKAVGTLEETRRMLEEASILSALQHPNIIRVFDADTVATSLGPRGFFTTEYVAGGSLGDYWASHRDRFVPVPEAVQVLTQVTQGLAVAHGEDPPIIHRDITPANVLVGYDAQGIRARVSDFGLAKRVDPLTRLASTRGTVAFKAPEALRNPAGDSLAADIWALGTIAYLILTDTFPFADPGGMSSFLGGHHRTPPAPPSRHNQAVDEELDAIVLHCLHPDPLQRIPDAAALLERLRARTQRPAPKVKAAAGHPTSKGVLGAVSPVDEAAAEKMVEDAFVLARQANTLIEAADLLEEAFNKSPVLRRRHAARLRLWRNGVVM